MSFLGSSRAFLVLLDYGRYIATGEKRREMV